jgi:hypothetical protein
MRLAHSRSISIALLVALLVSGCGYRNALAPAAASETGGTRRTRLAVLGLRNDSSEPWLDRIVTDAMRREMAARASFSLENDPAEADLVLRGRVGPLHIRSQSFSSFVAAVEYALTLSLDLEVVRSGGDVVRLDSDAFSESDVYLASSDIEVTRTNRLELLRRLSDLLAARVADSLELMEQPLDGLDSPEGSG